MSGQSLSSGQSLPVFCLNYFWKVAEVHWTIIPWPRHNSEGCMEMCNLCMTAFMFLTGHGIKARTHALAEIIYFPTRSIIRACKALGLWPRASQTLMICLVGKCAISTRAWVLGIWTPTRWAVSLQVRLLLFYSSGVCCLSCWVPCCWFRCIFVVSLSRVTD